MHNQSTVVTQSLRTYFTFYLRFVSVCLNKHLRQSKVEILAFDQVLASSSEAKPRRRLQWCLSTLSLACLEKWGWLKWRWQKRLLLKLWSCKDFRAGELLGLSRTTSLSLAVPVTAGIEQIWCFCRLKIWSSRACGKPRRKGQSCSCAGVLHVPLCRPSYICTITPPCSWL